jgi:hypothetical protein
MILFDDGLFEDNVDILASRLLHVRCSINGKEALHGKCFKGHVGHFRK